MEVALFRNRSAKNQTAGKQFYEKKLSDLILLVMLFFQFRSEYLH